MIMEKKFDWKEFIKTTLGVFFIGLGLSLVGKSGGMLVLLIGGLASIAVGIGLIASS